jgi:hypothetical protein
VPGSYEHTISVQAKRNHGAEPGDPSWFNPPNVKWLHDFQGHDSYEYTQQPDSGNCQVHIVLNDKRDLVIGLRNGNGGDLPVPECTQEEDAIANLVFANGGVVPE